MNKVMLLGRLTKEPEVRYTTGTNPIAVARYTLAVDRRTDGEKKADFISCVAFGKSAEFAEKYLTKGTKILVTGRIQTGSYKDKDDKTVYTTDIVIESSEFVESKPKAEPKPQKSDDFMTIPDGIEDELPFH